MSSIFIALVWTKMWLSTGTEFCSDPIEPGISSIPFACVYVMGGEDRAFAQQFIIKHQHRPIEELEFIVPE